MVVADVVAPQEVAAAVAEGEDVADSSRPVAEVVLAAVVAGAVVVEAVLVAAADEEEREVAVRR